MCETDFSLPIIDQARCTRCGICVERCPENALSLTENGPVFTHPENCTFCTICETSCPEGAIRCEFEIGWKK